MINLQAIDLWQVIIFAITIFGIGSFSGWQLIKETKEDNELFDKYESEGWDGIKAMEFVEEYRQTREKQKKFFDALKGKILKVFQRKGGKK